MSDAELNKAAVLIVKLLLRTREGRIRWTPCAFSLFVGKTFAASLEDQMSAYLIRQDQEFIFLLLGTRIPSSEHLDGTNLDQFLSERTIVRIALSHAWDSEEDVTPESIVYSNLRQIFLLAEDPKSVTEDRLYQQAMTYLDKIAV